MLLKDVPAMTSAYLWVSKCFPHWFIGLHVSSHHRPFQQPVFRRKAQDPASGALTPLHPSHSRHSETQRWNGIAYHRWFVHVVL